MVMTNSLASAAVQGQDGQQQQQQQQGSNLSNQAVVPTTPQTSAAYEYKPSTSTSGNLEQLTQEGGAYLAQAKQQGQQQAARRGLQNTALAGQSAAGEAIRAASPLAQADAQTEMQKWQLGATVSNNLRGQYNKAQEDLLNQYAISINQIETATDIKTGDKDKMIANAIKRRDADLKFMQGVYQNTPGFNTDWNMFPPSTGTTPPAETTPTT